MAQGAVRTSSSFLSREVTDNALAQIGQIEPSCRAPCRKLRPRPVVTVDREHGNEFGPPSPVIEIPVSWFLDDFPALENLPRGSQMGSTETLFARWKDHFDFAYERVPGGVFTLTVHPQTIGRAHAFLMFERFLDYVLGHEGVWATTLSEIASTWRDPDPTQPT